jgi:predicted RNA polymerase sigma factor
MVRSQPGQIVPETLPQKQQLQKRVGGVAQGVELEFKPQYCQKRKKERKRKHNQ